MAVKIPGAGITAEMAGRSRYGQWVGRVWLCRDLEKGSLQELMGGRDMARVVAGNGLYTVQIPGEGITTTLHEWQGAPNMSRGVAKEEAEDGCALCRYLEQGSLQKWLGGWPVGWQEGGCADT